MPTSPLPPTDPQKPQGPFDSRADEVPTARKVHGVWTTATMPSVDWVADFVASLTRTYRLPVEPASPATANIDTYNVWWRPFERSDTLVTEWANELNSSERSLLDVSCSVLSSHSFGYAVFSLKDVGSYPAEWINAANVVRSTTERLFDRLHINHVEYGGKVKRWAPWWSHAGVEQPPQMTIFGRRHERNAFTIFRTQFSTGGSVLGDIVGLTDAPDNFAMPLEWTEAVYSGLGAGIEAQLPTDIRGALRDFAQDLRDSLRDAQDSTFWAKLVGAVLLFIPGTAIVGGLTVFLSSKASQSIKSLEHWAPALTAAGSNNAHLNETAFELLRMLRNTDYNGLFEKKIEDALKLDTQVLFTGLDRKPVFDVERALMPQSLVMPSPGQAAIPFKPMIMLGDAFADYAKAFGTRPFQLGKSRFGGVLREEVIANRLWTDWWNASQPSVDVAYVIDAASMIFEQVIYIDDALLALNDLAVGDGAVAMILRRMLAEQNLTRYVDALGGVSPGAALRYFVRQILSDLFIETARVKEEIRRQDLHPIFTWMNGSARRDSIDGALGKLLEVTEETAGDLKPLFDGLKITFGYRPDDVMTVRGAFLPGATDEQRGALGRAFSTFAEYPGNAEAAAAHISHADLGYVRGWLELARKANLVDLRKSLEPDWSPVPGPTDPERPPPDEDDLIVVTPRTP